MTDHPSLWVRSDVSPLGTYILSINVGDDHAWTLTPDKAVAYAVTVIRRATEAEHDAAVLSLLTSSGVSRDNAVALVQNDLLPDRPIDHSSTEPLHLYTTVGRHRATGDLVPLIRLELNDTPAGEMTPSDARDHAVGVLKVVAAVDLDLALFRCLTGAVGTGPDRARTMIDALQEHWPPEEPPRRDDDARTAG